MGPHQARDPMLAYTVAFVPEHLVHTGTAVGATAFKVNGPNLLCESLVAALPLATLTRAPRIIACPGYLIDPAHQREIVLHPVYFDEFEDFRFRSEANRMAFFNSSCSSLSTLYRRSNSRSRLNSAVVCTSSLEALATITPSRTCFRHSDSMNG